MLTRRFKPYPNGSMRGFTIIELMIAVVVGMIAVAGALVLILAINKANSQTVQAARINQELRALAGVIADDIKRARRLHDPIYNVGIGTTASGAFDSIGLYTSAGVKITLPSTSAGSCMIYGYQDPTQNDPASTAAAVNNYRAVNWDSNSSSVVFIASNTAVSCPSKASVGAVLLNSSQVKITSLTFTCGSSTATATTCNQINLTISGQLTSGDQGDKSGFNSITRTFIQPIFIRSGAVKTS